MNIKKIGVSALAGSLMAFSANALEMSVSGGASITFSDYGADVTNNSWSMGDGITLTATGETDGGLTITTTHVLDGGINDDMTVAISTDGMGTITFAGLGGSSALGAVDDVMPTAYEEPWFGVTSPTKVDGAAAAVCEKHRVPHPRGYSDDLAGEALAVDDLMEAIPLGDSLAAFATEAAARAGAMTLL